MQCTLKEFTINYLSKNPKRVVRIAHCTMSIKNCFVLVVFHSTVGKSVNFVG